MKDDSPKMPLWAKVLIGLFAIMILVVAANRTQNPVAPVTETSDAPLVAAIKTGEPGSVTIQVIKDDAAHVYIDWTDKEGKKYQTVMVREDWNDLKQLLREHNVEYPAPKLNQPEWWMSLLISLLPVVLIVGVFLFIMRQAGGANQQAINFGKAKIHPVTSTTTFDDVAGCDEAKEDLREVVEFLQDPAPFERQGARLPRGVLLVGPPGTGKTLLARAVAGEAKAKFIAISGSEFVEMFVGVGASRVRDIFDQAVHNQPCVVFIDEIDAVGRSRGAGLGGSHDEREQTLNQILVRMDGFDQQDRIVVIAATNRPDILDVALTRPGRFDRKSTVTIPDLKGRKEIFAVHVRGKNVVKDINLKALAQQTYGMTGADIATIANEAAIIAARREKKTGQKTAIGMIDFADAITKLILGAVLKSRVISPEDKKLVAYHEGGHTILAYILEDHDNPKMVSILPRGMGSGGHTYAPPDEDRYYIRKSQLRAQIIMAYGGIVAETLLLGQHTSGPSSDIQAATNIAKRMVKHFAMSSLPRRSYNGSPEMVFLGKGLVSERDVSEQTAREIDEAVNEILEEANAKAAELLTKFRAKLDAFAQILIEKETLVGDELTQTLKELFPDPKPNDINQSC